MKAILIAVLGLGTAACQQQSSGPEQDKSRPEEKPAAAPDDPGDPASYVGMNLADAKTRADKAGIMWRVVEEDGESRPVTKDYRPDRFNFSVAQGKIIRVTKG